MDFTLPAAAKGLDTDFVAPRQVVILGSTGSIGTQALEVIRENPDKFQVVGLAAAGRQRDLLISQAREFKLAPDQVAVADSLAASGVSQALGGTVLAGPDSAAQLVQKLTSEYQIHTVLNGLVGSLGLGATLATLNAGVNLALANKESLVAGGDLVLRSAAPGQLIPVDSEHSAMAQALRSGTTAEVARLVLTASGGPFRGWTKQEMMDVTPSQAAKHPTWAMGQMNTLNSATLVNKGLELIEASLLFGISAAKIDVTVHPQSIIHSMVTFTDGATIAQASIPSMKLPIALALGFPHRIKDAEPAIDFGGTFSWDFEPVDNEAFPAVELAREVALKGGTWPAIYNAANEEAAAAFLTGNLKFPLIVDTVAQVVSQADSYAQPATTVADVLAVEKQARLAAGAILQKLR